MSELSQRLARLSPAKRQLLEQRLKQKPNVAEPIAIVGMACRFPGATNLDAYWRVIHDGVDAIGEIPPSRWNVDEFYDPTGESTGKMSTRWGGFLDDVDQFDPMFFGITPREAAKMDPQQRLLLEVSWEAMEQGGLAPEQMRGSRTGVFVGIGGSDYSKVAAQLDNYFDQIDAHVGTGNALSIAANRLSYILDLHGPSLAVDTACSSALVGVHLAVQSLRCRECDAALAGGVNMILSPETTIAFSKARMLSPSGHCRPFDAAADGYLRGEGCGIIILKRLIDATRAGDNVLAVLRNSAVNQDGRTSGITAPNSVSQQAVIHAALSGAGLIPAQVSYLEAHGTGTPLGDPIEVQGLVKLFRKHSEADPPCYMGSVKAHVGHTETAAGIASLIKVVLMMQHRWIPGQLHLEKLNPHISLAGTRLHIPKQSAEWRTDLPSRIAGVSAYGFGGTNAHVVLEEATPAKVPPPEKDRPAHLLTLSAKNDKVLQELAGEYAAHLDSHPDASLPDVCYSANTGRSHFNHRLAIVAERREQLREQLETVHRGKRAQGVTSGQMRAISRPKVAFLFTGQGSQYVGMGQSLFENHPLFRQAIQQCDDVLRGYLDVPLLSVLYPEPGQTSQLAETAYTQPALFALEYALATLWRSWGIEPDLLLGHSLGEYVAACVAGVFSLEDGLRLVVERAMLMQQLPRDGLMAVVFATNGRVGQRIEPHQDRVAIAAANGPENTVISGEADVVRSIIAELETDGIRTQLLDVSHAFHSPLMEPMLDDFYKVASQVSFQPPRIPIVSNLTGTLLHGQLPDADYWCRHIRNTVQFAAGMQALAQEEVDGLLELGPSPTLLGMGRRCVPKLAAAWLPSLRKGRDDWPVLLGSLAELYVLGVKVDWVGFDRHWTRRRVTLPTYPFERTRHWLEGSKTAKHQTFSGGRGPMLHPLLGSRVPSALESTLFEARLSSTWPKYLVDHQVQGSPVVPAAAYVELGLAAAEQAFGPGEHVVENVSIQHAMFLPEGASRVVQVTLAPEMAGERTFDVYSVPGDCEDTAPRWALHACGKLRPADPKQGDAKPPSIDLDEVRTRTVDATQRQEFYEQMAGRGLAYGPAFQVLDDLRRTDCDALAEVRLAPAVVEESAQYHLHPALLDACFQSMAGAVPLERDGSYSPFTYMPTQVRQVRVYRKPVGRMFTYAVRTSQSDQPSPETVDGDVCLLDENGQVLVELVGVRVQRFGRSRLHDRKVDVRDWLYRVGWQSQPLEEPATQTRQGSWLVFADAGGVAATLAENLRQQGNRCIVVSPDNAFASTATDPACDEDTYRIDPLLGEDYRRLLGEALGEDTPKCLGIVHLWSLDVPTPKGPDTQGFDDARRLGCGSVLRLLQQLARSTFAEPPGVWLVTQGAQAVVDDAEAVAVGQAALWGMGRVAAMEFPESRCRLVDVDPVADPVADAVVDAVVDAASDPAADPAGDPSVMVAMLAAELVAEADEDQIAYRGTDRYVARLEPAPAALKTDDQPGGLTVPREGSFRLRLGTPGSFDSLRFESFARRRPAAGQVEIEVHAAGLNFSDVLKVMGLYPGITDEVVPLGIECSGVITAVGPGVDRFKPGDEVMGVAPYSFASHVITAEYTLAPKPKRIDHDEASTVPVTFMTAYYALCRLAHLRPGERVLIHAGAGGVGLAAIQIAQNVGAEVFATAGSDRKRDFLRELGVQHVMSSRTLDFHDEIMQITDRQGVDVVLNSLPGDAITKSLASLRAYGRFLEIGKTDIYQNRMIGLLPFQDNLSYFAIDLDRMLRQRPDEIRELFAELMSHFEAGVYEPLPLTRFPVEDTVGAFRYMTRRKNIGKVVVSLEDRPAETADAQPSDAQPSDAQPSNALVRQDGTYLITGGSGALGLQVAGWLAAQGAQHLVLMSRRAPLGSAAEALDAMRAQGVSVAAVQGDVTDSESVAAALAQIPAEMPPLRGVVHAAGVLDDGVMFDMDLERLDRAMAPKVEGAWNLHTATLDAPLDFFVLFSSVACVLGSPGQANYAAGNAFLDGLAHHRRAQGLPAISVNWGPWAGSGMAVDAGRGGQMRARGMDLIPPETGLKVLGGLMRAPAANVAVMDVHWPDLLKLMPRRKPTLLRDVAAKESEQAAGAEGSKVDHEFRQKLLSVDLPERTALLQDYFVDELARIMGIEPASLDVEQPLNMLGLDSLMAIELKTNLETQLMFDLPMARFLESPSVVTLAGHAAESIVNGAAASDAPSPTDSPGADQRPVSYEDRAPVGASAESNAARPRSNGAAAAWSPLVGMQRDGGKPALFCVHPVGGDVRCYYYLARNKRLNRPVYALRARGMDGSGEPHHSMDEMIDDYLRSIREVQPDGPFHLAGWSTGGIFAYEMARRLAEQGASTGLLALFDSPMPSIFSNVDLGDDARFLYDLVNFANWFAGAKMSVSYDELHSQGPDQRLETVLHEAKRHRVVPADVSTDHIRRLIEVCKTHVRIVMDYTPVPFQQHLHIFRPIDTTALSEASGQSVDQDLGWGSVVGQNLTLREVPGNHFSMMTGENADQLAELLADCLEQARAEHAGETVQSD